jgi:hypothetical protein
MKIRCKKTGVLVEKRLDKLYLPTKRERKGRRLKRGAGKKEMTIYLNFSFLLFLEKISERRMNGGERIKEKKTIKRKQC